MKRVVLIAILISVLVALSACAPKIECQEPNKIVGNECCLDANDDDVCDSDKEVKDTEDDEIKDSDDGSEDARYADDEDGYEPSIDTSYDERPAPSPTGATTGSRTYDGDKKPTLAPGSMDPGVYSMNPGETRDYLTINKLSGYRSSHDKGYMDYMIYTVRNHEAKAKEFTVELMFRYGINKQGVPMIVGKKYEIDKLEPGEKAVIKQSLGIYFEGIDELKELELYIYDPNNMPRSDLDHLKKTFKPTDYFVDMETHTFGLEE